MESLNTIENATIRRQFNKKNDKWYFSIVDIVGVASRSSDPRNYWKVLKSRLKQADNELVTSCTQLKMMASDGKFYMTDVANKETMLKLIGLVSKENVSPFLEYFDKIDQQIPPVRALDSHWGDSAGLGKENSYPQFGGPEPFGEEYEGNEAELMLMIDGYCENNIIIIRAFVAGVDVENLLISTTCNSVTIKGERESPSPWQGEGGGEVKDYLYQELFWGKFSRTVTLPQEVEINKVEVSEYKGLLTIKLPIINKNRMRIVRVKS